MGDGVLTPVPDITNNKFREDYLTSRWIENTNKSQEWFDTRTQDFVTRYEQVYQLTPDEPVEVDGYDGKIRYEILPSYSVTEMI